jgi:hypothetical protein
MLTKDKKFRIIGEKSCSCGQDWSDRTVDGIVTEQGLWFDCDCKSTMLVPPGKFAEVVRPGRAQRKRLGAKPKTTTLNQSAATIYKLRIAAGV